MYIVVKYDDGVSGEWEFDNLAEAKAFCEECYKRKNPDIYWISYHIEDASGNIVG